MSFSIPAELFSLHEEIADYFIDGEIGETAQLIYPSKKTECDNCKIDPVTGQSSNIYKTGGPIPFTNHTLCPRCNGEGRLNLPNSDNINLRVYWDAKSWIDVGIDFNIADSVAMTIGYMSDLHKLEKAQQIVLENTLSGIRRYSCERLGEAVPWGFRRRYFLQYLKRFGGG